MELVRNASGFTGPWDRMAVQTLDPDKWFRFQTLLAITTTICAAGCDGALYHLLENLQVNRTQSFTLLCIRMEAQKHYEHSYNSWCWNKSYWGWVELWQEDCFSFSFLALLKKSPCCACLLEAVFVKLWGNCVVRRMFIITKKIYTFMSGNLSLVHAEMCVIFGLQTTWIFY